MKSTSRRQRPEDAAGTKQSAERADRSAAASNRHGSGPPLAWRRRMVDFIEYERREQGGSEGAGDGRAQCPRLRPEDGDLELFPPQVWVRQPDADAAVAEAAGASPTPAGAGPAARVTRARTGGQEREGEQGKAQEMAELSQAITKAQMPKEVEEQARKELRRLERMPEAAAEYGIVFGGT